MHHITAALAMSWRSLLSGVTVCALVACGNPVDDSDNLFPANILGYPDASDGGSTPDVVVVADDAVAGDDADGAVAASSVGGTYRLDCIKIEQLGSVGPDAFQTQFLGVAWTADIRDFKLNIMVDVLSLDEDAGKANLRIISGIGTSAATMCAQADTISPDTEGSFLPGVAAIAPETDAERKDDGHCAADLAVDAPGTVGTAEFQLATDELVWIYAEDNDATPFNCTADASPDAVPLHAVSASIVFAEGGTWAAGRLHGCLTFAEASVLCSCIGTCKGDPGEGPCVGCPDGSKPLADQLAGVTNSDECTTLMGEDAFDLVASFSAQKLPHIPTTCE